jgi:hypothetical protein
MFEAEVKNKSVSRSWTIEMHKNPKDMYKSYATKHNSVSRVKFWFDPKWYYFKYHNPID